MKKVCKYCNRTDFDADELVCSECGNKLDTIEHTGASGAPSLDNSFSYHKGDKTIVGGDNISAGHIDNRNVTTNSNTTINNIQNIIDESKVLVDCEISGLSVLKSQTAVCPECKKRISLEYYIKAERKCQVCYEKTLPPKTERATTTNIAAPPAVREIPPLLNIGGNRPPSTPVVEPIHFSPEGGNNIGGGKKGWFFITLLVVVLIVIGGAVYFLMPLKDKAIEQTPTETVVPDNNPLAKEENLTPPPVTKERAEKPPVVAKQPEATKSEPAPPSAFEEGEKAYKAGNHAKANLLFKDAAQNGNAGAYYYLSQMSRSGQGVSKSVKDAFSNMLKSAEGGYEAAFYEVAEMYRTGLGVESNRESARKWYEKASLSNAANSDKAVQALSKYYR